MVVRDIGNFDAAFLEYARVFGFAPEMEFPLGNRFCGCRQRSFEVDDGDIVVAKNIQDAGKWICRIVFVPRHHVIERRCVEAVFNAAAKRAITNGAERDG